MVAYFNGIWLLVVHVWLLKWLLKWFSAIAMYLIITCLAVECDYITYKQGYPDLTFQIKIDITDSYYISYKQLQNVQEQKNKQQHFLAIHLLLHVIHLIPEPHQLLFNTFKFIDNRIFNNPFPKRAFWSYFL